MRRTRNPLAYKSARCDKGGRAGYWGTNGYIAIVLRTSGEHQSKSRPVAISSHINRGKRRGTGV